MFLIFTFLLIYEDVISVKKNKKQNINIECERIENMDRNLKKRAEEKFKIIFCEVLLMPNFKIYCIFFVSTEKKVFDIYLFV